MLHGFNPISAKFGSRTTGRIISRQAYQRARLLVVLLTCLWCTGCTTALMHGGRDVDAVLKAGTPQAVVAKRLGKPASIVKYSESVPAGNIPELSAFVRYRGELPATTLIAGFKDYRFRGRVRDVDPKSAMLVNALFPIGEIVFFPPALYHAIADCCQDHRYRVWYDNDENYCGHIKLSERER